MRTPFVLLALLLLSQPAWSDTCAQHAQRYNDLLDGQKPITERLKAAKECSAEFFRASEETAQSYRSRAAVSRSIVAECPAMKVVPEHELIALAAKMEETARKLKGLC